MRLLLVRHAIAAPLGGQVTRDRERPLTAEGSRRFRKVAAGLVRLAPRPRAILTSPLRRARETAALLAEAWGDLRPEPAPALIDGDVRGIRRALAAFDDDDLVVLVGHENWISELTARLLDSASGRAFRYRKGGVALVEVKAALRRGRLLWLIPPRAFQAR
jgi:phosphohistidine phosphatase